MSSKTLTVSVLATFVLAGAPSAFAQDDEPIDIEVGTRRIGGPGTTRERKADEAWDAAVEADSMPMTEESLPPKGDKKRMPGLHKLAQQYFGGRMWKDVCDKYDQIIEEGGDEALDLAPEGKKNAARGYLECAQIAFFSAEMEKAEKLLKRSEKYGPSDHKHAALRYKMSREAYRKAMANGDIAGAMAEYRKYQSMEADEDERIWMGEELAKLAWAAYQSKDKVAMKDYIRHADEVAPMNTELRKLKDKLEGEENVLTNVITWGGLAIVLVIAGTQFSKWRARAKVRRASSGGFSEELDEEV